MKNHSYISMQQDMPDQGQLQVTVLDSASNRPVEIATVRISYTGVPDNVIEEIRTDFFDHIIRDSGVRDPHCSNFHRTVTGTVQHRHLQLSLIRHILLHGNIRMIFHKQRLLFVPESTLVLC